MCVWEDQISSLHQHDLETKKPRKNLGKNFINYLPSEQLKVMFDFDLGLK